LFNEVVEVDAHDLEAEYEVFAEDEAAGDSDDVLLVIGVVLFEHLEQLLLYEALLIEAFLALEDLTGDDLFVLVVEALVDLSEGALADPAEYFEAIVEVVVFVADVLMLVVVEAVVLGALGRLHAVLLAVEDVEEVDGLQLEHLLLLVVREEAPQLFEGRARVAGEGEALG